MKINYNSLKKARRIYFAKILIYLLKSCKYQRTNNQNVILKVIKTEYKTINQLPIF